MVYRDKILIDQQEIRKPHTNVITMGHVDHGKSTLLGRLLLDTEKINKKLIEKYRIDAHVLGKTTYELAWVMDGLSEERKRGLTIDLSYVRFNQPNKGFTLIDSPGHRDFMKNMIAGASQADHGILVVAVTDGAQPQTFEHMVLAKSFGLKRLIVIINKMDALSSPYSQEVYEDVKDDIKKNLEFTNFHLEEVTFIPTSAYFGENIVTNSDCMEWYNGNSFLETLNLLEPPVRNIDGPLVMPVERTVTITGAGTVAVGKVETGKVSVGDEIRILPTGLTGTVRSIKLHDINKQDGFSGEIIGLNIPNIKKSEIRRGDIICHPDFEPLCVTEFIAKIFVYNHPTIIKEGYSPTFHFHTKLIQGSFEEILSKIEIGTEKPEFERPSTLKNGDLALVRIRCDSRTVLGEFNKDKRLGRFIFRDLDRIIGFGVCVSIIE